LVCLLLSSAFFAFSMHGYLSRYIARPGPDNQKVETWSDLYILSGKEIGRDTIFEENQSFSSKFRRHPHFTIAERFCARDELYQPIT
jgi:hypothetical protein